MLTAEENDFLTRVGPGTPAGELLRRYWMPIALTSELTDERPTRFVRVLAEDLVLFRDKSGNIGLLADHCSHRGASLLYGRVEERGIACAYHGWLYDVHGNCLETPAEPASSLFHLTVKQRAYPVQKLVGMYWAYLGPEPVPVIPKYDAWVMPGRRWVSVRRIDANWVQAMENSVDPAHLQILHQDTGSNQAMGGGASTTRGLIDEVERTDFYETTYGMMKKRVYRNGLLDEHPIIFPNILRHQGTQIRVPIDDTSFWHFTVNYRPPGGDAPEEEGDDPPGSYAKPHKHPTDALHPEARFTMADVPAQDYMAWETQGPIANRAVERLATSDRGVVLFRDMLRREIEKVQRGEEPMGVIRDPGHEMIDTKLKHSVEDYFGRPRSVGLPV